MLFNKYLLGAYDVPGIVLEYCLMFLLLHCMCTKFACDSIFLTWTVFTWKNWSFGLTHSFRESEKSLMEDVHPVSKVEMLVIESSTLLLCRYHGGMLVCSDRACWERIHLPFTKGSASEAQFLILEFFQVCLLSANLT